MSFDYLNEAFKRLALLEEEAFDASNKGRFDLKNFMEDDEETDEVKVIDPEAETEEELKDSYIGKVITECNVCHSHIFENKEDIVIDEAGEVNVDKECPYCGESMGFTVIGEIIPFGENTEGAPVEDVAVEADVEVEEPLTEAMESVSQKLLRMLEIDDVNPLDEAVNNIVVDTDDTVVNIDFDEEENVTVSTEKKEDAEEVVTPIEAEEAPIEEIPEEEIISDVSDETKEDIADGNIETVEQPIEEVDEVADDEEDIDLDDMDEESFDELGESYLKNIYENVASFKTSNCREHGNQLVVEGLIKFTNGKEKKTGFVFEAHSFNNGKVRFLGLNEHFSSSKKAFALTGRVEGKKFIAESLSYNYKAKNSAQRVHGTVHCK